MNKWFVIPQILFNRPLHHSDIVRMKILLTDHHASNIPLKQFSSKIKSIDHFFSCKTWNTANK